MVGGQRGISACLRSRRVVFTGAPVGSSRGGSSHFTPLLKSYGKLRNSDNRRD